VFYKTHEAEALSPRPVLLSSLTPCKVFIARLIHRLLVFSQCLCVSQRDGLQEPSPIHIVEIIAAVAILPGIQPHDVSHRIGDDITEQLKDRMNRNAVLIEEKACMLFEKLLCLFLVQGSHLAGVG